MAISGYFRECSYLIFSFNAFLYLINVTPVISSNSFLLSSSRVNVVVTLLSNLDCVISFCSGFLVTFMLKSVCLIFLLYPVLLTHHYYYLFQSEKLSCFLSFPFLNTEYPLIVIIFPFIHLVKPMNQYLYLSFCHILILYWYD